MTKFTTNPKLGTRKVNLPVIGKTDVVDGIFEVEDSKVEEFSVQSFGYEVINLDAPKEKKKAENKDEKKEDGEDSKGDDKTEKTLDQMNSKELKEILANLKSQGLVKDSDIADLKTKAEIVTFLKTKLNG